MSMQLVDSMSLVASTTNIPAMLESINITPEMVKAYGSERSARYGTIAGQLSANDRESTYFKAKLYADWKAGYKEEHNKVYKSLSELAENCGESRANFGLYAKVGQVFFAGAPAVKGWTDKEYNVNTLFELSVLSPALLHRIDELLSTEPDKRISFTQARNIKEAYSKGTNKDDKVFISLFIVKETQTSGEVLYTPNEFIQRVCDWKTLAVSDTEPARETSGTEEHGNGTVKKSDDKSGYSLYSITSTDSAREALYEDGAEAVFLNKYNELGYKVAVTEHKSKTVSRALIHVSAGGYPDDIIIFTVSAYTADEFNAVLVEYNDKIRREMDEKGVGEYFHPMTAGEYVKRANTIEPEAFIER